MQLKLCEKCSQIQKLDVMFHYLQEINMILALLAAILHITDIQFDNDYDTEGVYILREEIMEIGEFLSFF